MNSIQNTLAQFPRKEISEKRKKEMFPLIEYIQKNILQNKTARLNFICTHNSRRSQLSQFWAQAMACFFQLPVQCYSGGVEITACHKSVLEVLKQQGFYITQTGPDKNPRYTVCDGPLSMGPFFSKAIHDPYNPKSNFAAVMTCGHADQNCPNVLGADLRVPLRYEDPKIFDNTPYEIQAYQKKSLEIAYEMHHIFSTVTIES